MNTEFEEQFNVLLAKYTELLVGKSNDQLNKKVEMWALYTHIAKSMPALASHWNKEYPDAKIKLKEMMQEIKTLNEMNRNPKK